MKSSAIVSVAIGEKHQAMAALSAASLVDYAKRFNLDLVMITEPLEGISPYYAKLACGRLLERYERLIFLDSDVLVAPDCPNILEIVPEDYFGAYLVSKHTDLHDRAIEMIQQDLPDIGWRHDYFNSGVMIFGRRHLAAFDTDDPDLAQWLRNEYSTVSATYFEQTYINYKVRKHRFPIFDIGYRFNHSLAPNLSSTRFGSYVIHCKGHQRRDRTTEIRRTRFVLEHPRLRELFIKMPLLASIYDLI